MTQSVRRKLTLAAMTLSFSVLLSRMLGFVRDAVIAYLLGAGSETDAYYAAFTLPDLMNYFLAGGTLSITFIPLYTRYRAGTDQAAADRLASVIITTVGAILVGLILVGELLAPWLVPPLFPGFDAAESERTVLLTRIVMPGQICFYVGGVLAAILMAHERFLAVALAPLIYNLGIIVFGLLLHADLGIAGFSVGALVGAACGPFLIPFLQARKLLRFRPQFSVRDEGFVQYIKLSLPLMIGVTLLTADEWISRFFGSTLAEGTITWLNNARRLMLVPMALIGQAAAQAALPFLSTLAADSRGEELGKTLTGTLRAALFLSTLAALFLAIFAEPAVTAIYERGLYLRRDSFETAAILLFFCPAIVAWAFQVVAVRGFYAYADTIRPMVIGTIVTAAALPLYAVLADRLDARGLALATSIGVGANACATLMVFQRRYGGLDVSKLGRSLAKSIFIGVIAAVPLVGLRWLMSSRPLSLPRAIASWVELAMAGCLFVLVVVVAASRLGGVEAAAVRRLLKPLRRRRASDRR